MDCGEIKQLINKEYIICCDRCHDEYFKYPEIYPTTTINGKEYKVCCEVAGEALKNGIK